jgi:hypothetical protein
MFRVLSAMGVQLAPLGNRMRWRMLIGFVKCGGVVLSGGGAPKPPPH